MPGPDAVGSAISRHQSRQRLQNTAIRESFIIAGCAALAVTSGSTWCTCRREGCVRYDNGLFLPVGGMTMDAAERATKADDIFVALLKKFTAQGQKVSPNKSNTYAPAIQRTARSARHQPGRAQAGDAAAVRRRGDQGRASASQRGAMSGDTGPPRI